jgi:hypothetical protein
MFHFVFFVHKAAILQGEGLIAQDLTSSWIIHEPGQKSRGRVGVKRKFLGGGGATPPLNSCMSELISLIQSHMQLRKKSRVTHKYWDSWFFTSTSVQIGHPYFFILNFKS